jgi:hypothetical protein
MGEWLIDAWNRAKVLSMESAWHFHQEVDGEINGEQEKRPTDELADDEFLGCHSTRPSGSLNKPNESD